MILFFLKINFKLVLQQRKQEWQEIGLKNLSQQHFVLNYSLLIAYCAFVSFAEFLLLSRKTAFLSS